MDQWRSPVEHHCRAHVHFDQRVLLFLLVSPLSPALLADNYDKFFEEEFVGRSSRGNDSPFRFHIFLTKISRQPFRSFKSMLADRRLATANLSATTISPRTLTRYLPISIASTSLRPIFGPKGIRLRCFLPCVYNLPNAGEIRTAELLD